MSERAPYSRVYWTVPDDPKFVGIYTNNDHFATWTRLLLIADQAHPASGDLPFTAKRASIRALSDAGLVDLLPESRFRIHGLDDERERRKVAASSRGHGKPTGRGPDGNGTGTGRAADGSGTTGLSRDEDETRRDKPSNAGTLDFMPTSDDLDALDVYHELTNYRPWGIWSGDALRGLIDDYTDPIVQSALRAEHNANGERKDLLDRLQARLAREAERAKRSRPRNPKPRVVVDNDALQAERLRLSRPDYIDEETA